MKFCLIDLISCSLFFDYDFRIIQNQAPQNNNFGTKFKMIRLIKF